MLGHPYAELPQAWSTDGDEQRRDCFAASLEVFEAVVNEFSSRQRHISKL